MFDEETKEEMCLVNSYIKYELEKLANKEKRKRSGKLLGIDIERRNKLEKAREFIELIEAYDSAKYEMLMEN